MNISKNERHNFPIKPQVNQVFLQENQTTKNHLTTPRALINLRSKKVIRKQLAEGNESVAFQSVILALLFITENKAVEPQMVGLQNT